MNYLVPNSALKGEIIAPGDDVLLVVAVHPLQSTTKRIHVKSGSSIRELEEIARTLLETAMAVRFHITINGTVVPEAEWSRVRVKPGVTVVMSPVPGFEDGNLLKSLATIAVLAAAIFLAPVIAPIIGLSVGIVSSAITIAGTLLVNALFPVAPPQLKNGDSGASNAYSISGGRNSIDPFGVIPQILGRHRVFPKQGALPHTEFYGDDQYLRQLFVVGFGPNDVSELKIGETPLASFEDVSYEIREGYVGDTDVTIYPGEVLQSDLSVDLTAAAGWQQRTTSTAIDEISVDVVAPNGIYRIDDQGNYQTYSVSVRVEYRIVGDTNWRLVGIIDFSSRSRDPLRRTVRRAVANGQYEVRVSKTSTDYSGEDSVSESAVWTALRGLRNSPPISYSKPLTIVALRIKATSQLNGVIDQFNCIVQTKGYKWSGSAWVADQLIDNPADIFRHVLQGNANPRPVADAGIDLDTLEAWADYCILNNFKFNMVRDFQSSVYDALRAVAAAGRATVIFRDGKWSVAYDQPNSDIIQHFTPHNSWGFSGKIEYKRLPHAWRVRFVNEDKGYAQDERIVYDDGYTSANATLFESIEFPGQTDSDLVWRHGRFHIAQARLRPQTYTINVSPEHLVATRGDRVRIQHDVPMFGLSSGRVKSVSGQTVVLSNSVTMEVGSDYAIRFRLADGTTLLRTVVTDDGENFEITLAGSSTMPEAGDVYMFGLSGSETVVMRISKINAGENLTAKLVLVDDAPAISTADSGAIPAFESNISDPVDLRTTAPVDLGIEEVIFGTGVAVTAGVKFIWDTLAGQTPISFEVEYKDNTGSNLWKPFGTFITAPRKYADINNLSAGNWSFRVRSIFEDGFTSGWATLSDQNLIGLAAVPGDVDNFRIQVIDDSSTLSWDPATGPVSYYVIRYAPVLVDATWGSATVLQSRVDATSVQVPTLVGTFLIKAVTAAEVESDNAASITSDVAGLRGLNVVEVWEGEPTWTGTHVDTEVAADALQLIDIGGVLDWPPIYDITELYWSTRFPYEFGSFTGTEIIDLGEIFTSRVSAQIDAAGDNVSNVIGSWSYLGSVGLLGGSNADQWLVRIYERHTSDDPNATPTWTEYEELSLRDITARAYQFKLHLYSLNPVVTPVVFSAHVTIDMPDRTIAGEDLLSNSGSTLRIDFDPPFRALEGLAIANQDLDTGDYSTITNKDETGFDIRFFNASDVGIAKTFDYVAKGYGKKVTA